MEKQTNTQALTEDSDKSTFHTTVALDQRRWQLLRVLITNVPLSSLFFLQRVEETMFFTKYISYTASWMKMSSCVKSAGKSMAFKLMGK